MHASRKQRLQQKGVGSATSLVIRQSHYVMQACKKKEEKRKEKGKERRKEKGKGIEEL